MEPLVRLKVWASQACAMYKASGSDHERSMSLVAQMQNLMWFRSHELFFFRFLPFFLGVLDLGGASTAAGVIRTELRFVSLAKTSRNLCVLNSVSQAHSTV